MLANRCGLIVKIHPGLKKKKDASTLTSLTQQKTLTREPPNLIYPLRNQQPMTGGR